jgi:hypothetical protein
MQREAAVFVISKLLSAITQPLFWLGLWWLLALMAGTLGLWHGSLKRFTQQKTPAVFSRRFLLPRKATA